MNTSNPITIGYWSTKGLGSACRQVVIYAGEKLLSKNYKLQKLSAQPTKIKMLELTVKVCKNVRKTYCQIRLLISKRLAENYVKVK